MKIGSNRWIGALGLVITLGSGSCKHDPFEPSIAPFPLDSVSLPEKCVDYDSLLNDCVIGPFYNDLDPAYMYPAINPNNPDEFAFYVNKKVYKHNMLSKTTTLLAENIRVIERMDWGAMGWITFSDISWKVWLLKDDGSVIKQMSFGERDLGPEFNQQGNNLIYGETQPLDESQMFIVNLEGVVLDSFCRQRLSACYSWDYCSWAMGINQFVAPEKGVAIYGLDGVNISKPYVAGQDVADIPDIEWLPDNKNILFITRYGNNRGTIYKVNIETEELTLIKEGCENRFYSDLSISPDGSFMLAQKGNAVVDGCDVNITWTIVKMDIDGSNEEILKLESITSKH